MQSENITLSHNGINIDITFIDYSTFGGIGHASADLYLQGKRISDLSISDIHDVQVIEEALLSYYQDNKTSVVGIDDETGEQSLLTHLDRDKWHNKTISEDEFAAQVDGIVSFLDDYVAETIDHASNPVDVARSLQIQGFTLIKSYGPNSRAWEVRKGGAKIVFSAASLQQITDRFAPSDMNIIQKYRTESGLSQEELADELGVSARSISRWENNIDKAPAYAIKHCRWED